MCLGPAVKGEQGCRTVLAGLERPLRMRKGLVEWQRLLSLLRDGVRETRGQDT